MSNQLRQLLDAGQSVWLDYLRRGMFASGELDELIAKGLRGMTSNPTIFEKAISAGNDYDEQLRSLIGTERRAEDLFWDVAVADIRSACDAFASVYEESGGNDGFVSLEVSPLLADDTAGTIAMAEELWRRVARPNVMIKIPGTAAGVPAIEECVYRGLNINVTLIFSIEAYEKTALAYMRGLRRRLAEGKPIDRLRSVNSVFVSRIDTAVDKILEERIAKGEHLDHLLGKTGVANLKLTYQRFKELFHGEEFAPLRAAGAAVQRPLWASTSTKNPKYHDLLYVEPVIGRETVNTMPPQTLQALLDHGHVEPDTVERNLDEARAQIAALHDAGISLFDVTHALQRDGVRLFSESFEALLASIDAKRAQLASGANATVFSLDGLQSQADDAMERLVRADFLKRLWDKDATLWSSDPQHTAIIRHALGWLDVPQRTADALERLLAFAAEARTFDDAVVLGMGGSSLAPDVLRATFGTITGHPRLHVLDSTDPRQIAALEARLDLTRTLFIVASKSGTTTEPDALYRYFRERVTRAVGARAAGAHFVAITDPGTPLAIEAAADSFRACFENDPDIGGRYSALSYFGMLPAAIAGYDVRALLDRAIGAMHAHDRSVDPRTADGLRFGATIGALARAGRDKLTIVTHPRVRAFGAWCEQLVAESTGKNGTGIVPIEDEPLGPPQVYGDDRIFVYVGAGLPDPDPAAENALEALRAAGHPVIRMPMRDAYDIGAHFYLWMIAIAAAGHLLGIDAFDQPNVQESKDNTKALLASYASTGRLADPEIAARDERMAVSALSGSALAAGTTPEALLAGLLSTLRPHDYVAIAAFIPRSDETASLLRDLRVTVRDARRIATTVGFGPRFLHSTGQLHKGGPDSVVMLQITSDPDRDLAIPGMHVGFRTLLAAQALGDWQSLDRRKRRGVRIHLLAPRVEDGLRALIETVEAAIAARSR